MKNTTILLLLITQSLISQIKYVESDTDSYIDFTNKKVCPSFDAKKEYEYLKTDNEGSRT